jgi:uncharacterized membrane protein
MNNLRLRIISVILAVIGLIDSIYLSWEKIFHVEVFCGGSGDCQTVANSPYSEIAGIPIAFLGVGVYIVIIALLYLEGRGTFWQQNSPLIIFGLTLAGTIYSIYLTYLEIAVIYAICPYCVISAVVMTLLFIVAIIRLFRDSAETTT